MRYFNLDSRDYEFKENFIAGLILTGSDVKAIRTQGVQFKGSRIEIVNGTPTIFNLVIPQYKFAQNQTLDTTTERKLLLNEKEIAKLQSFRHQKYMLVPIAIFPQGRWLKLEFGAGRKLRKYEKREKIKARELKRSGF